MPGRDYTRAYLLLQQSLDDGYCWSPQNIGLRGLTGLQNLPGDVWRRSVIDYEDNFGQDFRKTSSYAPEAPPQPHDVSQAHDARPSARTPSRTLSKRYLHVTKSKTPSEVLQLPTPETTPNSSAELFQPRGADATLSSSYTGSFLTAREDNPTPIPSTIRRKPLRTSAAENISSQVLVGGDLLERLATPDLPLAKLTKVSTGSPKHVKAKSQGQKSLRADLEGIQDETQDEIDEMSSSLPSLTMRNTNAEGKGPVPQASISFPQTPPPQYHGPPQIAAPEGSPSHRAEVVEAMVLDVTPPHRKRKLRHTPKDTDLRDAASQSGHSNRTSYSETSVLAMRSPLEERHLTQLQAVPSYDSARFGNAGHRGLRHTGKIESPRANQLETFEPSDNRQAGRDGSERGDQSLATWSRPQSVINDLPLLKHKSSSVANASRKTSASSAVLFSGHNRKKSNSSVVSHIRKPSTASGLNIIGIEEEQWGGHDYGRRTSQESSINLRRPSEAPSQNSRANTPHYRHFRSLSSPISFNSEGGYTPQIDEATAVNLYPHNNTSLLVVQRESMLGHAGLAPLRSSMEDRNRKGRPRITVDVPGDASDDDEGHNQGTVIRRRTTPPTVKVIPPSPADGRISGVMALGLLDDEALQTTPTRSSSLLQRARRYSDNVIQPFLNRRLSNTGSLSRNVSHRRRYFDSPKRVSTKSADSAETPKDQKLHPFWQPRYFWDGVNESSSDEDEYQTDQDVIRPVSELPANEHITQQGIQYLPPRRGGSLRFLLGNSLGIERQPTNRRLPMVRWPTKKGKATRKSDISGPIVQDHRAALPPGWKYANDPAGVHIERHDLRAVRSLTRMKKLQRRLRRNSHGSKKRSTSKKCGFGS